MTDAPDRDPYSFNAGLELAAKMCERSVSPYDQSEVGENFSTVVKITPPDARMPWLDR